MNLSKDQINNYFANNADIIIPGILGPWEFKIKNLHFEQKASGFMGGGIYANKWYILTLNGRVINKTSNYQTVFNRIINYIKVQHKAN